MLHPMNMRTLTSIVVFSSLMAASAPAEEPLVRVLLFDDIPTVKMKVSGGWNLTDASSKTVPVTGTVAVSAESGKFVFLEHEKTPVELVPPVRMNPTETSSTLHIAEVPYGVGWWWESKQEREYAAPIDLRPLEGNKVQGVAVLPLETYLLGVVPSEIGSDSPLEAQKAQAVAARSETVKALKTRVYAGPDYDICADVQCQAYSGNTKRSALSDQAVRETAKLVLTHKGEVIGAYYASNSGGFSENVENVWPDRSGPAPYWSGQFDGDPAEAPVLDSEEAVKAWIDGSPNVFSNPQFHPNLPEWTKKNFRWERVFKVSELTEEWGKDHAIGRVLTIEPLRRGVSGRIVEARIVGTEGSFTVDRELTLRRLFKPPLRSSCFYLEVVGPQNAPEEFRIVGAGYGHGVGMDQTGAIARAQAGQDFRQILSQYYRETEIVPAY
ncbi:SpoIID/LytB domain-containing protein [bacterium]|nr:SpoIID/LytB domain-containing protein [bacterium]